MPLLNGTVPVVANVAYAPACYKLTLRVPSSQPIAAGQFAHIRVDEESTWPLLRRPFSYWDARPARRGTTDVDLLYTVVGLGTDVLSRTRRGDRVGYLGPLGIGFTPVHDADRIVFAAGGVGIVPFYLFTRQLRTLGIRTPITLLFGARTKSMLWGIEDFPKLRIGVEAATEDGSRGFRGRVPDLLSKHLGRPRRKKIALYTCGPEPMLERVVTIARRRNIWCEASMEQRMGCALGACGACVTRVHANDRTGWRYSRICIEGPTYNAERLVLQT
jgi:dihydroorotate dehydrogenase electron transfer subunit